MMSSFAEPLDKYLAVTRDPEMARNIDERRNSRPRRIEWSSMSAAWLNEDVEPSPSLSRR